MNRVKNRTAQPPRRLLPQPVSRPAAAEPIEAEHRMNAALDAVETLVRNIVTNGGEAPLRARLERLLPPAPDTERTS